MDKWQFMNLDGMKIDLSVVNVNTRQIITEFISQWFDVHGGESLSATTILYFAQDVEILVKGLGYQLKLERTDDIMEVIVQ